METAASPIPAKKVNLRTPDVMEAVQAQVVSHYRSQLVEQIRERGGVLSQGGLTIKLAKEFGFCYGVERAINLAYAARKVFPDQSIYILGEIIHNPEVNDQIRAMGIKFLSGKEKDADIEDLKQDEGFPFPFESPRDREIAASARDSGAKKAPRERVTPGGTVIATALLPGQLSYLLRSRFEQMIHLRSDPKALRIALAAGNQNKLWEVVEAFYAKQGSENTGWVTDGLVDDVLASVPGLDAEKVKAELAAAGATVEIK